MYPRQFLINTLKWPKQGKATEIMKQSLTAPRVIPEKKERKDSVFQLPRALAEKTGPYIRLLEFT